MTKKVKRNLFRVTEVADGEYDAICAYCRTRTTFRIEAPDTEALHKALLAHQRKAHKTRAKYELKLTEFVPAVEVVEEAPAEEPLPAPPEVIEVKLSDTDSVIAHLEKINKTLSVFTCTVDNSLVAQKEIATTKNRFFELLEMNQAEQDNILLKLNKIAGLETVEAIAEKHRLEKEYALQVESMYSVINHPWFAQYEQYKEEQAQKKAMQEQAVALEAEKQQAQADFEKQYANSPSHELFDKLMKGTTWISAPEGLIGKSLAKTFSRDDAEPFMFSVYSKLIDYVQTQAKLQGETLEKWDVQLYQLHDAIPVIGVEMLERFIIFEHDTGTIQKEHKLSNGEVITLTTEVFCLDTALVVMENAVSEIYRNFQSKRGVKQVDACKPYMALWMKGKQEVAQPLFIKNRPKRNKETGEITTFVVETDGHFADLKAKWEGKNSREAAEK